MLLPCLMAKPSCRSRHLCLEQRPPALWISRHGAGVQSYGIKVGYGSGGGVGGQTVGLREPAPAKSGGCCG